MAIPKHVIVRVFPDAQQDELQEIEPDRFIASVRPGRVQGAANDRLRELFAMYFHVPYDAVLIVRGTHRTTKHIHIYGCRE